MLQSAIKTDSRAGDGTTTSTVLTQALVNEGLRFVSNGHNAVALQRGLLKSSAFVVAKIREMATPVTSYEQYKYIASLSAASEEYGTVIADAITRVGADGAIVVAPAQGLEDELLFTEGMGIETGYVSPMFVKEQETSSRCTRYVPPPSAGPQRRPWQGPGAAPAPPRRAVGGSGRRSGRPGTPRGRERTGLCRPSPPPRPLSTSRHPRRRLPRTE